MTLRDINASRSLVYRGDGDYDARINDTVELRLSYDGSDHMVGTWTLWDVLIDGEALPMHIAGEPLRNADSELVKWLEDEARKDGHLSDEPSGLTDAEYDRIDGQLHATVPDAWTPEIEERSAVLMAAGLVMEMPDA